MSMEECGIPVLTLLCFSRNSQHQAFSRLKKHHCDLDTCTVTMANLISALCSIHARYARRAYARVPKLPLMRFYILVVEDLLGQAYVACNGQAIVRSHGLLQGMCTCVSVCATYALPSLLQPVV